MASGVTSDIFTDFCQYLRGIEEAVRSFHAIPPVQWDRKQWIGFFTALQDKLGYGEWKVPGHGGGGSTTFRWHQKDDKYLRLNEDQLAFCLEVSDEAQQAAKRAEWSRLLTASNGTGRIKIVPARRKLGKKMTVAILDSGDYRQRGERGLLDLNQTVETLRRAEAWMDAALRTS